MAKADDIFVNMCRSIMYEGCWSHGQDIRAKWDDGTPAHTVKKFGIVNRYDLSVEFPILTLRPTSMKVAYGELRWIWQIQSNNVNDLNSNIWNSWADKDGSIGEAYGYQLAKFSRYQEGFFNQVDRVLYDLKQNPYSRRIMTNMYVHEDLHKMNLYPCAFGVMFNVTEDRLNATLLQRSSDVLTANNFNITQYAMLLHMFAQVSNLKVGELVHVINDAHIYDRHIPLVKELITREKYPAPKLIINPDITNFYHFTVDDFQLVDYQKGKQIKIPVAI